jgi:3D (Asp-Asp-Asp) domain-containing protein
VHDTGRKIDGREIDIFIDNAAEAKRFGKKPVQVRVLAKPPKETASAKQPK